MSTNNYQMTPEDVVVLLEGLKAEESFGLGQHEAEALRLAIQAVKDNERLRRFNIKYFGMISEYITTFDKWLASKNDPQEHAKYQTECKRMEKEMRAERDRVNSLMAKQQMTLDF